jgi:hypothetical protein
VNAIQKALEDVILFEAEATKSASRANSQINRSWEEIKNRIKGGESTGDFIRDFVIVVHGRLNEKIEANYRLVHDGINAHPGEFLLAVERRRDAIFSLSYIPSSAPLPPRETEYQTTSTLNLGIINGSLALDIKTGRINFPIKEYVFLESCWSEPTLRPGHFFGSYHFLSSDIGFHLNEPLKGDEEKKPVLEIIAGDQPIIEWLGRQKSRIFGSRSQNLYILPFYKMCMRLERYLPLFPEQTALLKSNRELFNKVHKEMGK